MKPIEPKNVEQIAAERIAAQAARATRKEILETLIDDLTESSTQAHVLAEWFSGNQKHLILKCAQDHQDQADFYKMLLDQE